MLYLRKWRNFVVAAAVLAVVVAAIPEASAGVIQPTPSLPPTAGSYTAGPPFCVSLGPGACIVGATLFGFSGTTSMFGGTGQSIDSSVSLGANIYTDMGGVPGTFLGHLLLGGPIGILYGGRMSDTQLGTFPSTLTELDLTGTFNGHIIDITLAPATSAGPTTVAKFGDFMVSTCSQKSHSTADRLFRARDGCLY